MVVLENVSDKNDRPAFGHSNEKKIKLVMSDLHLGDGEGSSANSKKSWEEFLFDQKLIEFLDYYGAGDFDAMDVEIILNGDFLNLLQVDYRGFHSLVMTESMCLEVLKKIIHAHKKVFDAMRAFISKPRKHITYIIGNHDQGMLWPACKDYLKSVVGTRLQIKNLQYIFEGVHIEHGHMLESANRVDPKKFFLKKNLVEPILNLPLGSKFFLDFVLRLKTKDPFIDKVRPFSAVVRWTIFNRPIVFLQGLFWLISFFIRGFLSRDPRNQLQVITFLKMIRENISFLDLSQSAERILQEDDMDIVILGHNHIFTYRRFEGGKEYFNTGTWTEVISLDISSLGRNTKLTYVYLEKGGSCTKYRGEMKEWRGYHRVSESVSI